MDEVWDQNPALEYYDEFWYRSSCLDAYGKSLEQFDSLFPAVMRLDPCIRSNRERLRAEPAPAARHGWPLVDRGSDFCGSPSVSNWGLVADRDRPTMTAYRHHSRTESILTLLFVSLPPSESGILLKSRISMDSKREMDDYREAIARDDWLERRETVRRTLSSTP
jgi:hypothetical protein